MILTEHDSDDFAYDADYLGIQRSDDLVIIQLTVSNTRPMAQKQELYRRIVEKLTAEPRPAPRGHLHQSGRGASGKLVVRPRRGAVRPMIPRACCRRGCAAFRRRPPRSCAAAPASCAAPAAISSRCPRAISILPPRITSSRRLTPQPCGEKPVTPMSMAPGNDRGSGPAVAARLRGAAVRDGRRWEGLSASGPAFRRDSRRSRAGSCGRASRPRHISPAADTAGIWNRPGPRAAPA